MVAFMERTSTRRWQFSLKWLLVITTFLAILAGVIGRGVRKIELRRQQVEQARLVQEQLQKERIAQLEWERLVHTHETKDGVEVFVDVRAVDDGLKKRLAGVTGLKTVRINGIVGDSQLVHLGGIQQLESINLHRSPITGKGLVHLKSMPKLKSVNLSQTGIDDDALKMLGQISTLEDVKLFLVPIRGSGLGHLKGLTKLRWLSYFGTTLEEVNGLDQLDQLERLTLVGPGLNQDHIQQIAGMEKLEDLRLCLLFDEETMAELAKLDHLKTIHFTLYLPEMHPTLPTLGEVDVRELSAKMPNTVLSFQTASLPQGSGWFKGGKPYTPEPRPSNGPRYAGGVVQIQGVFSVPQKLP
jgi:hypothetical protein